MNGLRVRISIKRKFSVSSRIRWVWVESRTLMSSGHIEDGLWLGSYWCWPGNGESGYEIQIFLVVTFAGNFAL